jgi:SAM-dependent methyltransferase
MNEHTSSFVRGLDLSAMDALEISGEAWKRIAWKSYLQTTYPDFDICYDVIPARFFDVIIAEQVFEHVKYPYRAARNVYRMLRPRGWFMITTPFLIQLHLAMDCTRWTATGLKYFLEDAGFSADKITTASWGNRECAINDFNRCAEGLGWQRYEPGVHSLENEPLYPIVVWGFAQK